MLCLADFGSPSSLSSYRVSSNKELSELIDRLQKNADQVERYIVDTDAKLQKVTDTLKILVGRGGGAVSDQQHACAYTRHFHPAWYVYDI